jgi:hypothetical protein
MNEENLESIKRNAQIKNGVVFMGKFYGGLWGRRAAAGLGKGDGGWKKDYPQAAACQPGGSGAGNMRISPALTYIADTWMSIVIFHHKDQTRGECPKVLG